MIFELEEELKQIEIDIRILNNLFSEMSHMHFYSYLKQCMEIARCDCETYILCRCIYDHYDYRGIEIEIHLNGFVSIRLIGMNGFEHFSSIKDFLYWYDNDRIDEKVRIKVRKALG